MLWGSDWHCRIFVHICPVITQYNLDGVKNIPIFFVNKKSVLNTKVYAAWFQMETANGVTVQALFHKGLMRLNLKSCDGVIHSDV